MTETLMRRHMVALTPAEVPGAQASLMDWCRAKVVELGGELREQRQNLRQAKAAKWKHSSWLSAISRTKGRMLYYAKIRAALQAGYLIVPNFDVEVVAVRTTRIMPKEVVQGYKNQDLDDKDQRITPLPPGQGDYVGHQLAVQDVSYDEADSEHPGKRRIHQAFRPTGYQSPEFPVMAVKPIVLEATQRAMALRVFDRIGVVTGQREDPLVLGQIIRREGSSTKRVSFFVAWWLDTRSL